MITDMAKYPPFQHNGAPWDHQREDFETTKDWEYFAFLWEMGCGKSKPIIDTAAHLFLKGEIDGLLIFSDKGCYMSWYKDQIKQHLMEGIPHRMAFWSSQRRSEDFARLKQTLVAKDDCLDILIMNIEALGSWEAERTAREFLGNHYSMMVIDESTSIKNPKAKRTQVAWELGKLANYRRIATGTPVTQGPLDLFSQCHFLKPGAIGFTSFTAFKHHYAKEVLQHIGNRRFNQIVGYQNIDQLKEVLRKFSSRRLKKNCLSLPEKVYEKVYVERTQEQEEAYRKMKEQAVLMFTEGQLVTATSALTALMKLHQINCGHVKLDDGTIVDIPSNRVSVVIELLEKLPKEKVTIWGHFQRDTELIAREVCEKFGPDSYVTYYGLTSEEDRRIAMDRFLNDPKCLYWIGSQSAGGKGLNCLVGSSYVIYYSNNFKLEARLQSEDRNHRPGQKKNVTYFDLLVPKSIDVKVLNALQKKKDLASEVLDTNVLKGLLDDDFEDLFSTDYTPPMD